MKLPNSNELLNCVYEECERQATDSIIRAAHNLQYSVRLHNSPVWELSCEQAKQIWNDIKVSLNSKGYKVTFDSRSSSTVISWG